MQISRIEAAAAVASPRALEVTVAVRSRRIKVRVLFPEGPVTQPPLLALHGISRKARAVEAVFAPASAAAGRVLIVPRFSRRDWPHFQTIGAYRADKALLAILSHLSMLGLADCDRVALFGYSGGAQLAHRFAMLYPHRVTALHVAAAGWYCLADTGVPFPLGLGQAPTNHRFDFAVAARAQLPAFLRLPVRAYVGAEDTARDPALRRGLELDTIQGLNRVARAQSFVRHFRASAEARGVAPDITLTTLPDCAHAVTECAAAGMDRLVCA